MRSNSLCIWRLNTLSALATHLLTRPALRILTSCSIPRSLPKSILPRLLLSRVYRVSVLLSSAFRDQLVMKRLADVQEHIWNDGSLVRWRLTWMPTAQGRCVPPSR
ncbi:hypothetical protein F5Y18DRAFT_378841 [Xylariaceae sp. FL1019]|nr:hypothetical protein F5Y18DRAFT_378841 [Xylariaceae sp. FL1019]